MPRDNYYRSLTHVELALVRDAEPELALALVLVLVLMLLAVGLLVGEKIAALVL